MQPLLLYTFLPPPDLLVLHAVSRFPFPLLFIITDILTLDLELLVTGGLH